MLKGPKALRVATVVLVHVLALVLLARAWRGTSPGQWLAGVVAGYVALDLVTLFVHWTLDNWFTPATPLIGGVVFYFRQHHVDPMAMFKRDFVDNNFENALPAIPVQAAALALDPQPFVLAVVGCMTLWCGWITAIHKAAHVERPPRAARLLQRLHLLVDGPYHDVHHRGAGAHYGLVAGWCEPLVDALRVLELLELVIVRLTGRIPVHARLETTLARARRAKAWAGSPP
jgi:hypothetical protein